MGLFCNTVKDDAVTVDPESPCVVDLASQL